MTHVNASDAWHDDIMPMEPMGNYSVADAPHDDIRSMVPSVNEAPAEAPVVAPVRNMDDLQVGSRRQRSRVRVTLKGGSRISAAEVPRTCNLGGGASDLGDGGQQPGVDPPACADPPPSECECSCGCSGATAAALGDATEELASMAKPSMAAVRALTQKTACE